MNKLSGKIAVITGGNSGIGLATARLFAQEGATVIITGRRQAELDAAVAEIGGDAVGVQGDVSKLDDLDQLYAEVKAKFGHIDIVFANAGIIDTAAPIGVVTEEYFDNIFNINVKGLLFTVQKALPLLVDGGSVILNSSIANTIAFEGFGVYCASKAAVRSLARTWTAELKAHKIRVNVVSPGPIATPILEKVGMSEQQMKDFGEAMVGQIPLGRFGQPEEVAQAVLFLASADSSYVAGVDLYVDGGMVAV